MHPAPPPGGVATGHASGDTQSTEAAERALLALVCAGDRHALEQLYMRYFVRLAKFFQNLTARADLAEELINDTMFEVWKGGASIGANASVLLVIMGLAYSRVQKHFADASADESHSQRTVEDAEHSSSLLTDTPSDSQIFLSTLPVEERTVVHLVYAGGSSRRETADIMNVSCDCVDMLLGRARASAKQYFGIRATAAPAKTIDPRADMGC
jgi:RNA polymerase sigma-70 factor, ECF subfamily